MAECSNIHDTVKEIFKVFQDLKGKTRDECKTPFWDLVVLTTCDEEQKYAFELQLEQKLRRKEIPLSAHYHVFADPPGPRAGCGTSTMNVICLLKEMYGPKLNSFRILLLNSGGQSQRLPSSTILGKVFMALPIGSPSLSMFEFKLCQWLPLLDRMAPGYFHTSSDSIEVYDLGADVGSNMGPDSAWTIERPGFTALAHPSSLAIGSTHGVFVLKGDNSMQKTTDMREARFVLQKPTEETMRKREAILQKADGTEFVYTDSTFFFDHKVADELAAFYEKEAPLNCEIDGYADFLQSLGEEATGEFTKDLRNINKVEPRQVEIRQKVYHLLKGTPLHVMAMNVSKFYHLGTLMEYLYHFCEDEVLAEEMGFSNEAFCKYESSQSDANGCADEAKRPKLDKKLYMGAGTRIHCMLNASSDASSTSIVEFCDIKPVLKIGKNCVMSSCSYDADRDSEELVIPDGTFMHTVAIQPPHQSGKETSAKYVTVAFHVDDNIKKKVDVDKSDTLLFFKKPLGTFSTITNLTTKDIFTVSEEPKNLWYARLFAVYSSMSESFHTTYSMIHALQNGNTFDLSEKTVVSMADVLQTKDAKTMLEYRDRLYNKILSE